jgi:hypothetical protein
VRLRRRSRGWAPANGHTSSRRSASTSAARPSGWFSPSLRTEARVRLAVLQAAPWIAVVFGVLMLWRLGWALLTLRAGAEPGPVAASPRSCARDARVVASCRDDG